MSTLLQRISIDTTFGACLIGAQISAMFYGLTTLQTYLYYVWYPEDSRWNKALVYIIWFLDTLHTAFVSMVVYHYLVTNYDNPPSLAIGHWSLFTSLAINTVIACIVQIFFVTRIFRLTNSRPKVRWWLSSVVGISVVVHFWFGIETVVLMFIKKELARLSEITLFPAIPFALFAVVSDILITASLCVLLYGRRTAYRKTNTIVATLIVYAINRCLLTSIVAIVEVVVFATMPKSLWFMAIDFSIGKLYANSLLATLNSRESIKLANARMINSIHLSDIEFTNSSRPRTDTRSTVLELHAESTQRSSNAQTPHFSVDTAKDKVSSIAPDNV